MSRHKDSINDSASAGIAAGCKGDVQVGGGCKVGEDIGYIPAVAGSDGVLASDGGKSEVLVEGFGAGIQIGNVVPHVSNFPSVAAVKVGVARSVIAALQSWRAVAEPEKTPRGFGWCCHGFDRHQCKVAPGSAPMEPKEQKAPTQPTPLQSDNYRPDTRCSMPQFGRKRGETLDAVPFF